MGRLRPLKAGMLRNPEKLFREASHEDLSTSGIVLAKNSFAVYGVDAAG